MPNPMCGVGIALLRAQMYCGSYMNGRRGIMLHAIGAVEMALWDLKCDSL